ncbi:motility associated factor glycosyltransferase family protein [Anaerosporobacter faecicola]|uniref:motility associated factor glycosyltransferase family protein n=1 Tax=Anaerosporobacter faecicola TaxID=2718714 RepID=UPI00143CA14F|nr:6-hydroxymethylpterin diphosphokinase MptE-like protein [Anaerosporobacter faecicola]
MNYQNVLHLTTALIENIDLTTMLLRQQNYDRGLRTYQNIITLMERFLQNYNQIEEQTLTQEALIEILSSSLKAQEWKDYILLADLLELQLRPFIIQLLEWIMMKLEYVPVDHEKENLEIIKKANPILYESLQKKKGIQTSTKIEFFVEFSSSGLPTIRCNDEGIEYYVHSNNNPDLEAYILATSWYSDEKTKYIVYGLGLGYHLQQLCACNPGITIDVYEGNMTMLYLAVKYGVLGYCLTTNQVNIHYDPQYKEFANKIQNIDEETEVVVYHPSVRMIAQKQIKERIEEYFMHYHSVKNQRTMLCDNFKSNRKKCKLVVDSLKSSWNGKNVYIVAAGPSLDKNYKLLSKKSQEDIILATGTVYHKLMSAGIRPDYVIVSDGNARIIHQIDNLENETIPLLILSTAYKGFAQRYKGEKYLIYQQEFSLAEEVAKEEGYHLYQTGGSVATIALDLAITLGANKVVFLGLDLAYPDNLVHAEGTSRRNLVEDESLKKIPDIRGNLVKTSKHLDLYRRWIEQRIKNTATSVEFIDATEGGAYIEGTKIMKMSDVITR